MVFGRGGCSDGRHKQCAKINPLRGVRIARTGVDRHATQVTHRDRRPRRPRVVIGQQQSERFEPDKTPDEVGRQHLGGAPAESDIDPGG